VDLVLQGIDPTLFHPAPKSGLFKDRFVVFSGGKIEYRKGQDLVLLVFRVFLVRHPEVLLVTAWHGSWPELALSLAANTRIAPVPVSPWIPAFAGMTELVEIVKLILGQALSGPNESLTDGVRRSESASAASDPGTVR
jgi:glycosyltransferase involved in cell wall biosynthesis